MVVVQDADLEYDPSDLPSLLEPILSGEADVVYGSRYLNDVPQDPSFLHRFGNQLLTWASNLFTGLRLTDMETCYKMIPRPLLQSLEIQQNRFGFEPEVTAKLARRGVRIKELPIRYEGRGYEEGKEDRLARRRQRLLLHRSLPVAGLSSGTFRCTFGFTLGCAFGVRVTCHRFL